MGSRVGLDDVQEVKDHYLNEQDSYSFKYKDVSYTVYHFNDGEQILKDAESGKIKYKDKDDNEKEVNVKVRGRYIIAFESDNIDGEIEDIFNSIDFSE